MLLSEINNESSRHHLTSNSYKCYIFMTSTLASLEMHPLEPQSDSRKYGFRTQSFSTPSPAVQLEGGETPPFGVGRPNQLNFNKILIPTFSITNNQPSLEGTRSGWPVIWASSVSPYQNSEWITMSDSCQALNADRTTGRVQSVLIVWPSTVISWILSRELLLLYFSSTGRCPLSKRCCVN